MNQIPNLITSVRLFAALALVAFCFFDRALAVSSFVCLFVTAGVSDMLDGFIARKFNWCSEFGAKLDSLADLSLYLAVLNFLAINSAFELRKCGSLFVAGGIVQTLHLILSFWRHKRFPAYHTTFSRACAYLMFFGVLAFWIARLPVLPLLVAMWIACSLEGIVITLILRQSADNLSWFGAAVAANEKLGNFNRLNPHGFPDFDIPTCVSEPKS